MKEQGRWLKRSAIFAFVLAVLAVLGLGGAAAVKLGFPQPLPTAAGASASQEILGKEEIAALVEGRTKALASGDEEEFLSVFGDEAREQQGRLFRNLKKLDFAQARFLSGQASGTGTNKYGGGAALTLDVAFVHQIKDVDTRPVSQWYRWSLKKESKGDDPVVTKAVGAPDSLTRPPANYPAPWDLYEEMHVEKGAHSLTIADGANASDAKRYAAQVDAAAKENVDAWKSNGPAGAQVAKSYFLVFEPNREKYHELFMGEANDGVGWEAGHAIPMLSAEDRSKDPRQQFGGSRIVVDSSLKQFRGSNWKSAVTEIARHEIAHAMLQPMDASELSVLDDGTGKSTKMWLVEGFAEYLEHRGQPERGQRNVDRYVSGKDWDGLPDSGDFELDCSPGEEECTHVSTTYTLSYLATRFIADKGGERALFQFASAHYLDPTRLDAQLQQAVGMNAEQFEAAWKSYVRSVSK